MIQINESLTLAEGEILEEHFRASGPGGQNVNKVATGIRLRFDVLGSASLPDEVRQRLVRLAGKRITAAGELILSSSRYRSQERNRQDALDRLVSLIRRAAEPPRHRRPTRPTRASIERRLEAKRRAGRAKRERSKLPPEE